MGYLLNDSTIGVLFNDRSTLLRVDNSNRVVCIEESSVAGRQRASIISEEYCPASHDYRLQLFKEFEAQLAPFSKKQQQNKSCQFGRQQNVYLHKWIRLPTCILFRLSNGLV